ncbi:MAG: HD domain-containing protein [Hyphomicrobiales bacterium]|nr:MAG: HD domain-containing protein [Hyphomicrobiales bacterium]
MSTVAAYTVVDASDPVEELVLDLSMARGLDEIMAIVREYARPLVGADGITFVLRDGDQCHYADEDAISPLWKGQRFPATSCISGWAMMNRQLVVIENIYADDRIPHAAYRPTFVKSLVMVPVRIDDPVAAIGAYWARQRQPTDDELRILQRIANSAAVAMTNVALLEELVTSREEAIRAKDAIIFAMASLAEVRDNETGNHLHRTQHYVRALAEAARSTFPDHLNDTTIELIFKSAPLHDIGKIGVPDKILLKPGKLDPEEFEIMRGHAELGRRAIDAAEKQLGTSTFLAVAKEIAHTHHEKWNGSGYPQGLVGTAIPLSGRLMAIADVYDALVSGRAYKEPIPHAKAVRIIAAERGKHFDPALVDVFLKAAPKFEGILRDFAD